MDSPELAEFIIAAIKREVAEAGTITAYREPLVGFAAAEDARFSELRRVAEPTHMMPQDLLSDARSVVSFFLPFEYQVVEANARHKEKVAREWAEAYVETNALIGRINSHLIELLAGRGVHAAAQPATHKVYPDSLVSRWSHKSVAVIGPLVEVPIMIGLVNLALYFQRRYFGGTVGVVPETMIQAAEEACPPPQSAQMKSNRPKENSIESKGG